MRDNTESRIVDFTQSFNCRDLDQATIDATRLRLIDTIGVALAASNAPPVLSLIDMAPRLSDGDGARIWMQNVRTTADHAALVNGTMVRYLDMSDAYTLTSTAHPSDNIPALVAVAEQHERTFADLVKAIVVSYEIQCRFCDVAPFHQNGWDQPIVGAPAAAMGAACLLSLNAEQSRHALALATTPNLPTYRTRRGTLSMWKNIAGPNGARLGVHAAMMAACGITGPEAPFEGRGGLWEQTLGEILDVPIPTSFEGHTFAVAESDIKLFPIRNACQLPVILALELRGDLQGNDIENVTIWTDRHAFGTPAEDPALWAPATRESADHSLPFCVAAALIDGNVDLETFENARYLDADIRHLMSKIKIAFDPAFDRRAPAHRGCRIEITRANGAVHKLERIWAPDDPARIPSAAAVYAKFERLAQRALSKDNAQRILSGLRTLGLDVPASKIIDPITSP